MNPRRKKSLMILGAVSAVIALSGNACTTSDYDQRKEQNKTKLVQGESQEERNLKEKIKRDEASGDKIGYVYIMSFGKFIGYYTIKGKVSSNDSQLYPQDEIICRYNSGDSCQAVDGPQDDNTYGDGDPGVFFYTTEGAMIVTNLDYLYADQPIAASIEVPKLNK